MMSTIANSHLTNTWHLNFLLLLGIAIFGGTIGARLFRKLHFPQLIGYIIVGLIVGESGLKLISEQVVSSLDPLSYFALGVIGFMIGGELRYDIFKKYGKQFIAILLAEGIAAFLLVGAGSFLLAYVFTGNLKLAVALGVVLGAISSATDPASTIEVLWEYKTRGPLTTTAIAIVALDDALALSLYAFGTSVAGILTGHRGAGPAAAVGSAVYELGLALLVGFTGGLVLKVILTKIRDGETALAFAIGAILLTIGLSITLGLDVILSSMALGLTLVNISPRQSKETFEVVKKFSPPIYILFFVFVGARLKLESMSYLAWSLAVAYILGRSAGKISGAYLGAKWSKARKAIGKYLGLCLFAQGGVAIGLSIIASQKFDSSISSIVILVVAATTIIVQLVGPLFIKSGVKKAGEIGMNVTEEDLIKTYSVADVMDTEIPVIYTGMPLREVIKVVSNTSSSYYPVVDNDKKLAGAITLDEMRNTFATQELNDWLVALDIMEPIVAMLTPETQLSQALEQTKRLDLEYLPVVASSEDDKFVGILDCRSVRRSLSAEVLSRQQKADNIHTA
ncbi:MAG: sodium:proton exchanger [Planctomycetota bacterium]|nr:MAG: sodium:proton exchanger [Planctomycetota bacterium]